MMSVTDSKNSCVYLMAVGFAMLVCCGFSASHYAWDPGPEGIREESVRKMDFNESRRELFALTDRGIYRKGPDDRRFTLSLDFGTHGGRAYDLYVDEQMILAATSRGIWVSRDGGKGWNFEATPGQASQSCSYCVFYYQNQIFCGTQNGFFVREISEGDWSPVGNLPLGTAIFEIIAGNGSKIFAASEDEIFSLDFAVRSVEDESSPEENLLEKRKRQLMNHEISVQSIWKKESATGLMERPTQDEFSTDGELTDDAFDQRFIKGMMFVEGHLWAVMRSEVRIWRFSLESRSDGAMDCVSVLSLPDANINDFAVVPDFFASHEFRASDHLLVPFSRGPKPGSHTEINSENIMFNGRLWIATDEGVFCLLSGKWISVYSGLPTHQIDGLYYDLFGRFFSLTDRGIFYLKRKPHRAVDRVSDNTDRFSHEPSMEEVRVMVVAYADVGPEKIHRWKAQSRVRALIPSVSLDLSRDASDLYHWDTGASPDQLQEGEEITDWKVSLKWDFSDAIWSSDALSIDSRSKLMVELREELLSRAVRLYFERRRLQMELLSENMEEMHEWEGRLRLEELTAQLNGMTGGQFSRSFSTEAGDDRVFFNQGRGL